MYGTRLKSGIAATASALGVSPVDLATAISYETAGTFDPTKRGPTTRWGQHRGLIQFGEPQAQRYGVDWNDPIGSQLGPNGAVANYLRDTGVKPGMGLLDIYSAINAGGVGRYNRSDANNGGAPGTVADKVRDQMSGHRRNAMAMFGGAGDGTLMGGQGADTMNNINFASTSTGPVNAVSLEELEQKEALAKVLQARSSGIKDVRHWTQGAAQMSDALFGALMSKKNSEDRKDHNAALAQVLMGNGGGGPISEDRLAQITALNPKLGTQLYAQQREAEQAQQLQAQRMAADHARRMDDRAYAAAQTADQRTYDQQQWQQRQQAQNDEWTRRQEYARENAPRPKTSFIVSGEKAAEYSLDPAGSYNITTGPNGVSASRIGGSGTNVTVNTGAGEGEFAKVTGRELAQSVNEMASNGDAARQNLARIDRLESLLAESGSGGLAGIKGVASNLGLGGLLNASDVEAARALINSMVPEQRPAGSGPMSDADLELFKQSLPRIVNTPGGNAQIIQTIRGIAQYDMERGKLARDLQLGAIGREEYFSGLQNLSNPLAWLNQQAEWTDMGGGIRIRQKN